jgi:hypothetical protein
MKRLSDSLSKSSGKDGKTNLTYHKDADDKKIKDYAARIMKSQPRWGYFGPNCKTFAADAIAAGKKKDSVMDQLKKK